MKQNSHLENKFQRQLQSQNRLLRQLLQTLQRQIHSKNKQQAIVMQQLEHLGKDYDKISIKYAGVSSDLKKYMQKQKQMHKFIKQLQSIILSTQKQNNQLKLKLINFDHTKQQLQNKLVIISQLQIKNKQYSERIINHQNCKIHQDQYKAQMLKYVQEINLLQGENKQLVKENLAITTQSDQFLQELRNLGINMQSLVKKNEQLQFQVEECKKINENLKNTQSQQKNNVSLDFFMQLQQSYITIQQQLDEIQQRNQQEKMITQQLIKEKDEQISQLNQKIQDYKQIIKQNNQIKTLKQITLKRQQSLQQSHEQTQVEIDLNFLRNSIVGLGSGIDFNLIAQHIGFNIEQNDSSIKKSHILKDKSIINNNNEQKSPQINNILSLLKLDKEQMRFSYGSNSQYMGIDQNKQHKQIEEIMKNDQIISKVYKQNKQQQTITEQIKLSTSPPQQQSQTNSNQKLKQMISNHYRQQYQQQLTQTINLMQNLTEKVEQLTSKLLLNEEQIKQLKDKYEVSENLRINLIDKIDQQQALYEIQLAKLNIQIIKLNKQAQLLKQNGKELMEEIAKQLENNNQEENNIKFDMINKSIIKLQQQKQTANIQFQNYVVQLKQNYQAKISSEKAISETEINKLIKYKEQAHKKCLQIDKKNKSLEQNLARLLSDHLTQQLSIANVSNINNVDNIIDQSFIAQKQRQISNLSIKIEQLSKQKQLLSVQIQQKCEIIYELQNQLNQIENRLNAEAIGLKKNNAYMNSQILRLKKELFKYQVSEQNVNIGKFLTDNFSNKQQESTRIKEMIKQHKRINLMQNFNVNYPNNDISMFSNKHKLNMTQNIHQNHKYIYQNNQETLRNTSFNMGEMFMGRQIKNKNSQINKTYQQSQLACLFRNSAHQPDSQLQPLNMNKHIQGYDVQYRNKFLSEFERRQQNYLTTKKRPQCRFFYQQNQQNYNRSNKTKGQQHQVK